jgi:hypothetical protein
VGANQTLTLGYAGTSGAASGGIFTVAISGGTEGGAVKANAFKPLTSTGAIADNAELAATKVLKTAAATTDLGTDGTAEPAAGVITGTTAVTIDKDDTFAVTDNAITVTGV